MITAIKGRLCSATPLSAVVETASGLFYEVNLPLTTSERLPKAGSEVLLHTLDVYREDSQTLYGFASAADRDFFKTLVEKVSGIGPKIALNMMSRMSAQSLGSAIVSGDVGLLSKCPGIGKKTAERLVLELRGALGGSVSAGGAAEHAASEASSESARCFADAVAALIALGLKPQDADKYARAAAAKIPENEISAEAIIKAALQR